jgi:hypothetical protein
MQNFVLMNEPLKAKNLLKSEKKWNTSNLLLLGTFILRCFITPIRHFKNDF